MRARSIFVSTFIIFQVITGTNAFLTGDDKAIKSPLQRSTPTFPSLAMRNDDEYSEFSKSSQESYLDGLTPPPIELKRESLLFSENPSTKRDNEVLDTWKACKNRLPPVITGAWPWRSMQVADEDPVGALYNIAFVRIPVIGVGIAYIQHTLVQGHPLVMDMGYGPFEMSPLIVLSVLAFVLA